MEPSRRHDDVLILYHTPQFPFLSLPEQLYLTWGESPIASGAWSDGAAGGGRPWSFPALPSEWALLYHPGC